MRTIGSRTVYENRWMTVREDRIERDDGSAGIYGVVDKPDFALVIPFDGDAFYLVEQYRYPVGARFREFPQGSWEKVAGADPEALARGELEEETGLRAGSMKHLGHLYEAYGYSTQGFDVYLATELEQGLHTASAEEQDMRVDRIRVADFEQLVRGGEIKDAPTVAAYGLLRLNTASG